jgi:hypothetical protein
MITRRPPDRNKRCAADRPEQAGCGERPTPLQLAVQHLLHMMANLDERLIYRTTQQQIIESDPAHWLRRAEELEAAAPRPGQYLGQATAAELSERWHSCMTTAAACRHKAAFLLWKARGW